MQILRSGNISEEMTSEWHLELQGELTSCRRLSGKRGTGYKGTRQVRTTCVPGLASWFALNSQVEVSGKEVK